jgi:hypothetical protein
MIDRLILGVVLSVSGWHGMFPDPTVRQWKKHSNRKPKQQTAISEMEGAV